MKLNSTQPLFTIEQEELQKLLTEVKETIATEVQVRETAGRKVFSAADLWNIHRNTRYRVQRRSNI